MSETLLERDGEGDERVAWVVFVDPGFDLREPLILLANVVLFAEVDEVCDRLGGEKMEGVDELDLRGESVKAHFGWATKERRVRV